MKKCLLGTDADREELQRRIGGFEPRVRRRIRGKLRRLGSAVYDVDDALASARRRIDAAALQGGAIPCDERELCAYVFRVAEHAACDARRRERRQGNLRRHLEHETPAPAEHSRNERIELTELLESLDPLNRTMIELIARGLSHAAVAEATGLSLPAHRSRWRRLLALTQARESSAARSNPPGRGGSAHQPPARAAPLAPALGGPHLNRSHATNSAAT